MKPTHNLTDTAINEIARGYVLGMFTGLDGYLAKRDLHPDAEAAVRRRVRELEAELPLPQHDTTPFPSGESINAYVDAYMDEPDPATYKITPSPGGRGLGEGEPRSDCKFFDSRFRVVPVEKAGA